MFYFIQKTVQYALFLLCYSRRRNGIAPVEVYLLNRDFLLKYKSVRLASLSLIDTHTMNLLDP